MTQTASRTDQRPAEQHLRGGGQDGGRITVADGVVQKIAGMAAREVSGVYAMGTGTARTVGAMKERIPGSIGPSVSQGVGVEVGENEAAVDLDIVVEYGISASELGKGIQRNVKSSIERMTGLDVVEVNVNINDVHLPEDVDGSTTGGGSGSFNAKDSSGSGGDSRVS